MKPIEYWIKKLNLLKHPEGGYYREIYRSNEVIDTSGLPNRYFGNRAFSTSIYYLLKSGDLSAFHRLKSDEIWHFYLGSPLLLLMIDDEGQLSGQILGNDPEQDEQLQIVIGKGCWFAASVLLPDSYSLMGCSVSPGFDFNDFELAKRDKLLKEFPQYHEIIVNYTIS